MGGYFLCFSCAFIRTIFPLSPFDARRPHFEFFITDRAYLFNFAALPVIAIFAFYIFRPPCCVTLYRAEMMLCPFYLAMYSLNFFSAPIASDDFLSTFPLWAVFSSQCFRFPLALAKTRAKMMLRRFNIGGTSIKFFPAIIAINLHLLYPNNKEALRVYNAYKKLSMVVKTIFKNLLYPKPPCSKFNVSPPLSSPIFYAVEHLAINATFCCDFKMSIALLARARSLFASSSLDCCCAEILSSSSLNCNPEYAPPSTRIRE